MVDRVSRSFIHLSRSTGSIRVDVPDVLASVVPFLGYLGWQGHPVGPQTLAPGPARRLGLQRIGAPNLGPDWRSLPTETLWAARHVLMQLWRAGVESPGEPTALDLAVELAWREASPCRLCSLRCGARRMEGEVGLCGAGRQPRAFSLEVLVAEEPGLGRGAAVRLSGCNCRCLHCTRPDGVDARSGVPITVEEAVSWLEARAAEMQSVFWVGGESVVWLPFQLEVMRALRAPLPCVFVHNCTATAEIAIPLLEGVVDVWVPDLRHGPGSYAAEMGAPAMDFAECTASLEAQIRQDAVVCVRHLALPESLASSRACLEFLARYRDKVFVSLMDFSYMPVFRAADHPRVGRPLNGDERETLTTWCAELGLRRVS